MAIAAAGDLAPDVLGVERDVDAQQQHARGDQDARQQAELALDQPHAQTGEQTEDAKRRQRKAQRFDGKTAARFIDLRSHRLAVSPRLQRERTEHNPADDQRHVINDVVALDHALRE